MKLESDGSDCDDAARADVKPERNEAAGSPKGIRRSPECARKRRASSEPGDPAHTRDAKRRKRTVAPTQPRRRAPV